MPIAGQFVGKMGKTAPDKRLQMKQLSSYYQTRYLMDFALSHPSQGVLRVFEESKRTQW